MPDEIQPPGTEQPASPSPSLDTPEPTAPAEGSTVNDALRMFDIERLGAEPAPAPVEPQEPQEPQEPIQSPAIQPGHAQTVARDYSGLSEEEIPVFKRMGNSAFDYFKPKWLESKKREEEVSQLKAQLTESAQSSFYDNPEAYTVTPEYKGLSSNISLLDREINHWKAQMAAIRAGKSWVPILLNDKGQPVLGEPQEPNPESEADVLSALQEAHVIRKDLLNKRDTLQTTFGTQHKTFVSKLGEIEKTIFKNADQKVLNQAMGKRLVHFPKHLHSDPRIQIIAKLWAVVDGFALMMDEQKSKSITAKAKASTARTAGPGVNGLQPAGGKSNSVGAAMDEWNKAKAAGVY